RRPSTGGPGHRPEDDRWPWPPDRGGPARCALVARVALGSRAMNRPARATAAAPASVGNVGVGFDILGHAIVGPVDRVTVERMDSAEVRIVGIEGVVSGLPLEAERNTAGSALLALRSRLGLIHGFSLRIEKGIPLGSGMGGSAASCVAALVAANAVLERPAPAEVVYQCALTGESAASGAPHGDNRGAMLRGGPVVATHARRV